MADDYKYPHSLLSLPVYSPPAPQVPAPIQPAAAPAQPASSESAEMSAVDKKLLEGQVIQALTEIFDPEIPVNIYELGLIYDIQINDDKSVVVKMTLTAPACPVAGSLPGEVEQKIEAIPQVKNADVQLVWEPPWSRDRMSEAALLTLGML